MRKCEVCKKQAALVVSTYSGLTVTLMCLACLKIALEELHPDTNMKEWTEVDICIVPISIKLH
ncbi:MAG: hypothetical protein ACXACG_16405 [Candidatus Thorarchaeota archaeon]|jgi:hypothetical protein